MNLHRHMAPPVGSATVNKLLTPVSGVVLEDKNHVLVLGFENSGLSLGLGLESPGLGLGLVLATLALTTSLDASIS